jgi:hypothetical protein
MGELVKEESFQSRLLLRINNLHFHTTLVHLTIGNTFLAPFSFSLWYLCLPGAPLSRLRREMGRTFISVVSCLPCHLVIFFDKWLALSIKRMRLLLAYIMVTKMVTLFL